MSYFQLFPFVFDSKKKKKSLLPLSDSPPATSGPKRVNPAVSLNEFSSMRLPVKRSALFHHTLINAVDWQAPRHRILLQLSYG